MSYDVQLFRKETMLKEQQSADEDFWDNENNLEPFTTNQKQELHERLLKYGYIVTNQENEVINYGHRDGLSISVMLTDRGLYFQTAWNEEGIFEIRMTASEFTDNEEFVKYDPQNDGWEEF